MYRVAEYKCSVCNRTTQIIEERQTQGPLSCNITFNCTGYLTFVKYRTTRTQIVSSQISASNPVEDFIQRGFDTAPAPASETSYVSMLSGKNAMNIILNASDVKSSIADASCRIPKESIVAIANESSDALTHISERFFE